MFCCCLIFIIAKNFQIRCFAEDRFTDKRVRVQKNRLISSHLSVYAPIPIADISYLFDDKVDRNNDVEDENEISTWMHSVDWLIGQDDQESDGVYQC